MTTSRPQIVIAGGAAAVLAAVMSIETFAPPATPVVEPRHHAG
jgi:hypothetical protein